MWIATGSLFIALAVFLNSIELSSQGLAGLPALFPYFKFFGLPPLKELPYSQLTQEEKDVLRKHLSDSPRFTELSILYERRSIIVGYQYGDYIRSVTCEKGKPNQVFDRRDLKFESVTKENMSIMGAGNLIATCKQIDANNNAHRAQFRPWAGTAEITYGLLEIVHKAETTARLAADKHVAQIRAKQAEHQLQNSAHNSEDFSTVYRDKFIAAYNAALMSAGVI